MPMATFIRQQLKRGWWLLFFYSAYSYAIRPCVELEEAGVTVSNSGLRSAPFPDPGWVPRAVATQKNLLQLHRGPILEELHVGGQGSTFRIQDRKTGTVLVAKTGIPPSIGRQEARMLQSLRKDYLTRHADDPNAAAKNPFLWAEYDEQAEALLLREAAVSAADQLSLLGPSKARWSETKRLSRELVDAAETISANHILHLDLKPSNIVFSNDSEGRRHVRVIDFGLARDLNDTASANRPSYGTRGYRHPEQFELDGLPPQPPREEFEVRGVQNTLSDFVLGTSPARLKHEEDRLGQNVKRHFTVTYQPEGEREKAFQVYGRSAHFINPEVPKSISVALRGLFKTVPEFDYFWKLAETHENDFKGFMAEYSKSFEQQLLKNPIHTLEIFYTSPELMEAKEKGWLTLGDRAESIFKRGSVMFPLPQQSSSTPHSPLPRISDEELTDYAQRAAAVTP